MSNNDDPNYRLKQRLWGATVLIALAVIFLPMILKGSGSNSHFRRVEQLRAEPPHVVDADGTVAALEVPDGDGFFGIGPPKSQERTDEPAQIDAAPVTSSGIDDMHSSPVGQVVEAFRDAFDGDPATGPGVDATSPRVAKPSAATSNPSLIVSTVPHSEGIQPVPELPAAQARDTARDTARVVAQPVAIPQAVPADATVVAEALEAWVVQAGSFAEQGNAIAVRDRLRGAGFATFISEWPERQLYRVRIGPMIDAARTERVRTEVSRLLGREAIILSYP